MDIDDGEFNLEKNEMQLLFQVILISVDFYARNKSFFK